MFLLSSILWIGVLCIVPIWFTPNTIHDVDSFVAVYFNMKLLTFWERCAREILFEYKYAVYHIDGESHLFYL